MDAATQERKSDEAKKTMFAKWLDEPMVRMGLSTIPAGDRADALRLLLQSAFDAGFQAGSGNILGNFLEAMLSRKFPDAPR